MADISSYLRDQFLNPPKGGNGAGVPTHDFMSDSAGVLTAKSNLGGFARDSDVAVNHAGTSLAERSGDSEDPNPTGATGPNAQENLRASLEAGEAAARYNVLHSGRTGQVEMRNYKKGSGPTLELEEAKNPGYALSLGSTGTITGMKRESGPLGAKPVPVLNPNTASPAKRRDDKPSKDTPKSRG